MKDETGKRYGNLVVVGLDHIDKKHNAKFLCQCDCGCTTVVKGCNLRSGKTKSCGCLIREHGKELGIKYGKRNAEWLPEFNKTETHRQQAKEAATIHGESKTRLFRIWSHMHERCEYPKGSHAKWYYEKGIRVCDEWKEFAPFRDWAYANGYFVQDDVEHKFKLSIDRIDPNKGYSPENCRWITVSENSSCRNQYYANQR